MLVPTINFSNVDDAESINVKTPKKAPVAENNSDISKINLELNDTDEDAEIVATNEVKTGHAFDSVDGIDRNLGGYAGTGFATKEGYESALDFAAQAGAAAFAAAEYSSNTAGWLTTEGLDATDPTVKKSVEEGRIVDIDTEDFTKDVEDLIKHSEAERKASNPNSRFSQDYLEAERLHYLLSLKLKKTNDPDEQRCIKNMMLKCLAVMADLTTDHDYANIFDL